MIKKKYKYKKRVIRRSGGKARAATHKPGKCVNIMKDGILLPDNTASPCGD